MAVCMPQAQLAGPTAIRWDLLETFFFSLGAVGGATAAASSGSASISTSSAFFLRFLNMAVEALASLNPHQTRERCLRCTPPERG